jgi:hypothetical protein
MRFGFREQAGKATENLQEGRHSGVVERHVNALFVMWNWASETEAPVDMGRR